MSVIYEITASVEPALTASYEEYMIETHIPDLLATGHFVRAEMARSEGTGEYRISYESPSLESLQEYLDRDAARLRADMHRHFPSGVEISRENWTVLSVQVPAL
jgi:hypothetical protein